MTTMNYWIITEEYMGASRPESAHVAQQEAHPVDEWWQGINPEYLNSGIVCPFSAEGPLTKAEIEARGFHFSPAFQKWYR